MPHLIEAAKTGRAKCRGCGQLIAAKTLRFGERVANPFSDDGGESTNWYHVTCAAFMRPEAFLETVATTTEVIEGRADLEREAHLGVAHRRLRRATETGRAPTGRAVCRACKKPIEKDGWRIALKFYEEGRFSPSGFIHVSCAAEYLETTDMLGRIRNFSPELTDADMAEIAAAIGTK